ncbi:MAG: hypothetical protein Fur0025_04290 [Oscillatoriaceae cyanobacterium]
MFDIQTTYAAGTSPRAIAIGHFNSDSILDIAVANRNNNNISIFLGDGAGGFDPQINFPVGTTPTDIAVGDFDNDTILDIAVTHGASNNLYILPGDGAGNFGAPSITGSGFSLNSLAVGQFNGDANLDAVTGRADPNIAVLMGNGAGGFGPENPYSSVSTFSIAVGDFDGDTDLDIAAANFVSNTVSIFLNNGSGNFTLSSTPAVGTGPVSVTVGYFDGDGNLDLAVANNTSSNVSVLLGNGAGGFGPQSAFPVGTGPLSIVAEDFSGDGIADLAVTNSSDDNVSVLLGDGAGGFGSETTHAVGNSPAKNAIGDFNGDGNLDLAVANYNSNNISILLSKPIVSITPGITPTEAGPVNGTFNITLDTPAPIGGLTVNFNLTGSTATPTTDYSFATGPNITAVTANTFTIAAGATTATLTVVPVDNNIDNDPENIIVNLASGTGYFVDTISNTATLSITNDDIAGITVNPTTGLVTTEAGGTATFTVVLDSEPIADVTVGLSSDNTAEGTVNLPTLTFTSTNWNIPQTVTVTGVNDNIDDGDIPYNIITAPASTTAPKYSGLNAPDVAVTNTDDDTAGITVTPLSLTTTEAGGTATFTVVLDSEPTANVTVNLSSDNPAEGTINLPTLNFTAANWNIPRTITVTGVDDNIADGNIPYNIIIAPAISTAPNYTGFDAPDVAVTNTDNEITGITVTPTSGLVTTEAGGTATFTVVLDSQPTADVTISLTSDNPAEGTVNLPTLNFTATNWNIAQTVTVTGVDDDIDDGDIAYNIVTTAASPDANYNGFNVPDVAVTNTDDDTAGITVTPTSGLVTTEAGGTATFTVVLDSQPTADVTVNLTSDNPAEGKTLSPLTFTAANWNIAQTITITGADDNIADGNIAYNIITTATSTDTTYNGFNIPDVAVTNTDDDTAGITVTPTSGLVTTEAGGTATFTVVLNTQPTADVTINLTSDNTAEGTTLSPLTFTAANWNIAQTVTITGVDDNIADGDIAYNIVTTATSSDTTYNGFNVPDVAVTNTDNDTAGITVTPTSLTITEGGATASYDMVLSSQPTAPVTINFTPNSQISPIPAINFDSSNWNVPQTVTVTAVDDGVAEGLHTGSITHSAVSTDANYSGIVIDAVQASITDNDVAGVSVIQPVSRTDVIEGESSDIFKLVLTSQPTADVTVAITTDSQTTTNVPQVIFTPTNWNLPQTVTVTAVDDTVVEGLQSNTISFAAASADGFYNGFAISPLTVNVSDNDRDSEVTNLPAAAFQSFGAGDDVINASSASDIGYGGAGNDIIDGAGGDDFLYGQLGDDIIDAGDGQDLIWGGAGNDHLNGSGGNDVVFAGDGSDRLRGGAGNDELFGEAGNDHLYGDAGADSLTGGLGRDAFAIGNGTGGTTTATADIITDFTLGEDVIDLVYPLGLADISITQNGADTVIQHQGTGEYLAVLLGITAADIGASDFS